MNCVIAKFVFYYSLKRFPVSWFSTLILKFDNTNITPSRFPPAGDTNAIFKYEVRKTLHACSSFYSDSTDVLIRGKAVPYPPASG